MEMLTVSKAKAGFSKVTRDVIKNRRPVIIRTPAGFVQIAPYDLPEDVPPAKPGTLKLTARELNLHNTFGDSL
ncbi:MAG TPA: hypothetical protein PLN52_18535 [Opitutaceae bacterium]|nr:hypothetical protein [Opitutaceae bacterium]